MQILSSLVLSDVLLLLYSVSTSCWIQRVLGKCLSVLVPYNVAMFKNATQSATRNGGEPQYGVDGLGAILEDIPRSIPVETGPDPDTGETWWRVDLGEFASISYIILTTIEGIPRVPLSLSFVFLSLHVWLFDYLSVIISVWPWQTNSFLACCLLWFVFVLFIIRPVLLLRGCRKAWGWHMLMIVYGSESFIYFNFI